MPAEGRYLYCVTEHMDADFGKIGIDEGELQGVGYKEITAVVSPIPFKTMDASLPNILIHQKVVEACRAKGTTLPVRFGVIFKNESGVKEMLSKSYDDYLAKLVKLKGKDEFGAKVILDDAGLKKLKAEAEAGSEEIGRLKTAAAKASRGTSYLLKIKVDEATRTEAAKRVEAMSRSVYSELARGANESTILKSEHEQIILNAAYLVDASRRAEFQKQAETVKRKYEKQGLTIHLSGPWAPYSFC
jgi:hypothetical protein